MFNGYDDILDSTIAQYSSQRLGDALRKYDFTNNRGRIFLTAYENGKQERMDSIFKLGMGTPCSCLVNKDTIFINMGIGFFGGMALKMEITRKGFQSNYYEYMDSEEIYKLTPNGNFINNIDVKNKYQYLILDKHPVFEDNQKLNGYLTFTTPDYYEKSHEKLDTNYVSGKIYFTCITQKQPDLKDFMK